MNRASRRILEPSLINLSRLLGADLKVQKMQMRDTSQLKGRDDRRQVENCGCEA